MKNEVLKKHKAELNSQFQVKLMDTTNRTGRSSWNVNFWKTKSIIEGVLHQTVV